MWTFKPLQFGPTVGVRPEAPAWADPRALMAVSAWRYTPTPVTNGVLSVVCVADSKRIALGFVIDPSGGANGRVRPQGLPEWWGWSLNTPAEPIWFDLFTYGAIVNEAWVITPNNNSTVGVVELYRLS